MDYTILGRTGLKVSAIGMGCGGPSRVGTAYTKDQKISKEEYLKKKKEFEDTEYDVRKCKVCGSEEFEFVSEERVEEPGEYTSDIGYYKCKKCGAK